MTGHCSRTGPAPKLAWSEPEVEADAADPAVVLEAIDSLITRPRQRERLALQIVVERLTLDRHVVRQRILHAGPDHEACCPIVAAHLRARAGRRDGDLRLPINLREGQTAGNTEQRPSTNGSRLGIAIPTRPWTVPNQFTCEFRSVRTENGTSAPKPLRERARPMAMKSAPTSATRAPKSHRWSI